MRRCRVHENIIPENIQLGCGDSGQTRVVGGNVAQNLGYIITAVHTTNDEFINAVESPMASGLEIVKFELSPIDNWLSSLSNHDGKFDLRVWNF